MIQSPERMRTTLFKFFLLTQNPMNMGEIYPYIYHRREVPQFKRFIQPFIQSLLQAI